MDKRKNNGGHSTKGKAGRKPKDEERRIRDITSPYTSDAIETVVSILTDIEAKSSDRLAAAKLLLSYAYGNPTQTVDQNTNLNINDFDISKIYDPEA